MRAAALVPLGALLAGCASGPAAPRAVDASVVFATRGAGEALEVEGRIHCAMSRPNELTCALSHEGERSVTVCFHVEVTCRNGNRTSAESCRQTAPGTEIRTLHAADGCDAVDTGRVTDAWIVGG